MPELPEVETIVRGLKPRLEGATISQVEVLEDRTIQFDQTLITEVITEQKISSMWRRAKVMLWDLTSGYTLLFHLKMTGQLVYRPSGSMQESVFRNKEISPDPKYQNLDTAKRSRFAGGHPTKSLEAGAKLPDNSTRVIWHFTDGATVFFNDQRKFGWIKLLPTKEVHSDAFLKSVGPEHDDAASFTPAYLWSKVRNRITPIKALLLDQTIVAGIGNIYADEALHLAKIHPARKASSLSKAETAVLFNAILEVLKQGVAHGGTSFSHYVDANGGVGGYIKHARVFRRDGQACPVCGSVILKTRVAGRGTHYCPTCQQAPRA